MASLHEQYRPADFAGVVGQPRAIAEIERVLARGWGGRAWLIHGASGTGKTTLGRIIAARGADPFDVDERDAKRIGMDDLREIERGLQYRGLGKDGGKAVIVNECQNLSKAVASALLVSLEPIPKYACWIFTTTRPPSLFAEGDIGAEIGLPFLSRCSEIALSNDGETVAAMGQRAAEIARLEGLDGLPDGVYKTAAEKCKGNMRQLLQRIESGAFRADARDAAQRELDGLASTKGERAEARRKVLIETLAKVGQP